MANWSRLIERWLLLGGYGPDARFQMATAWAIIAGFVAVDIMWLSFSDLDFAGSNWDSVGRLVVFTAVAFGICGLASQRLIGATDRIGVVLRGSTTRVELLALAVLIFALLAVLVIVYCSLATAAALALQDAKLARIDRALGFDWIGFVKFANSSALASLVLVKAYQSTPYMLFGTLLWFCVAGQGRRLAEFLALLCITSAGIAAGMMLWPAAGAYAHYQPPFALYENFGAGAGMWHHELLMALRGGAARVIDFTVPNANCLVTFPSGHTILAIIMTYALRGSRWTLIPALAVNGAMLVSTIPEGGHHLVDLIAGGAIAACAICFLRFASGARHHRMSVRDGGLAGALR